MHAGRQPHPSTWLSAMTCQTTLCTGVGGACTWYSWLGGMIFKTGAILVDGTNFPHPWGGQDWFSRGTGGGPWVRLCAHQPEVITVPTEAPRMCEKVGGVLQGPLPG